MANENQALSFDVLVKKNELQGVLESLQKQADALKETLANLNVGGSGGGSAGGGGGSAGSGMPAGNAATSAMAAARDGGSRRGAPGSGGRPTGAPPAHAGGGGVGPVGASTSPRAALMQQLEYGRVGAPPAAGVVGSSTVPMTPAQQRSSGMAQTVWAGRAMRAGLGQYGQSIGSPLMPDATDMESAFTSPVNRPEVVMAEQQLMMSRAQHRRAKRLSPFVETGRLEPEANEEDIQQAEREQLAEKRDARRQREQHQASLRGRRRQRQVSVMDARGVSLPADATDDELFDAETDDRVSRAEERRSTAMHAQARETARRRGVAYSNVYSRRVTGRMPTPEEEPDFVRLGDGSLPDPPNRYTGPSDPMDVWYGGIGRRGSGGRGGGGGGLPAFGEEDFVPGAASAAAFQDEADELKSARSAARRTQLKGFGRGALIAVGRGVEDFARGYTQYQLTGTPDPMAGGAAGGAVVGGLIGAGVGSFFGGFGGVIGAGVGSQAGSGVVNMMQAGAVARYQMAVQYMPTAAMQNPNATPAVSMQMAEQSQKMADTLSREFHEARRASKTDFFMEGTARKFGWYGGTDQVSAQDITQMASTFFGSGLDRGEIRSNADLQRRASRYGKQYGKGAIAIADEVAKAESEYDATGGNPFDLARKVGVRNASAFFDNEMPGTVDTAALTRDVNREVRGERDIRRSNLRLSSAAATFEAGSYGGGYLSERGEDVQFRKAMVEIRNARLQQKVDRLGQEGYGDSEEYEKAYDELDTGIVEAKKLAHDFDLQGVEQQRGKRAADIAQEQHRQVQSRLFGRSGSLIRGQKQSLENITTAQRAQAAEDFLTANGDNNLLPEDRDKLRVGAWKGLDEAAHLMTDAAAFDLRKLQGEQATQTAALQQGAGGGTLTRLYGRASDINTFAARDISRLQGQIKGLESYTKLLDEPGQEANKAQIYALKAQLEARGGQQASDVLGLKRLEYGTTVAGLEPEALRSRLYGGPQQFAATAQREVDTLKGRQSFLSAALADSRTPVQEQESIKTELAQIKAKLDTATPANLAVQNLAYVQDVASTRQSGFGLERLRSGYFGSDEDIRRDSERLRQGHRQTAFDLRQQLSDPNMPDPQKRAIQRQIESEEAGDIQEGISSNTAIMGHETARQGIKKLDVGIAYRRAVRLGGAASVIGAAGRRLEELGEEDSLLESQYSRPDTTEEQRIGIRSRRKAIEGERFEAGQDAIDTSFSKTDTAFSTTHMRSTGFLRRLNTLPYSPGNRLAASLNVAREDAQQLGALNQREAFLRSTGNLSPERENAIESQRQGLLDERAGMIATLAEGGTNRMAMLSAGAMSHRSRFDSLGLARLMISGTPSPRLGYGAQGGAHLARQNAWFGQFNDVANGFDAMNYAGPGRSTGSDFGASMVNQQIVGLLQQLVRNTSGANLSNPGGGMTVGQAFGQVGDRIKTQQVAPRYKGN